MSTKKRPSRGAAAPVTPSGRAAPVRRRLPRAERRELLLRAAAEVFGGRGYAAAAMDEIAAAAGVTKLILYRHFASKAQLYRSVLAQVATRHVAALAAGAEGGGFGVGAGTLLAIARADAAGFRLFWRQAPHEPEFARDASRLCARTTATVRAALAPRVPARFLDWSAHAVVGYLVEAVMNWLAFGDPAFDAEFVRATDKALRAGVRAWSELSRGRGRRGAESRG